MKIRTTYICKGAIYCGFKPEGVKVKEKRFILYPEKGFVLERISDKEHFDSVWLKDDDTEENYIEVKDSNNVLNVD